jgi:hypothetical protein
MPFSASSFSRHRPLGGTGPADYPGVEGPKPPQQPSGPAVAAQSHGPAQDANPLNRLTEEQREEINEAVRIPTQCPQDSRQNNSMPCILTHAPKMMKQRIKRAPRNSHLQNEEKQRKG